MPTPEHLHLALNHIPILGVPLAGVVAAWGLLRRSPETLRAGLVLTLLCALLTPVVMLTGDKAHDNYDGADFVDSAGYAWMTTHEERAETAAVAAYAAGGLAALALAAGFVRHPKAAKISTAASGFVVASTLVTGALAVWTADSGGKIRRPDFRPPAVAEKLSTTPEP